MTLLRSAAIVCGLLTLTSCATLKSVLWDQDWASEGPAKAPAPTPAEDRGAFLDNLSVDPDDRSGMAFALRALQGFRRANGELTAAEEYSLGRAFGAQILTTRVPLDNARANRYLNLVGQSLARVSERPDTYSGYRFLILDSQEINAFAAPGGFIFVSKGLIKLTRNEAELAAVLAHEIGHVEQEHGLKAIRKDRLSGWMVSTVADGAQSFGNSDAQQFAAAFEDSITDLTKTIVNNGYSRETEFEADASALRTLDRAGYPPQALLSMLEVLKGLPRTGGQGFERTHPQPEDRIREVKGELGRSASFQVPSAQQRRFRAALGGI